MTVILGPVSLRRDSVSVRESLEEVGGRDARIILLTGLVERKPGLSVESQIDGILEAASRVDYTTPLSLREGRQFRVRRAAFTRETDTDAASGSYTLTLEARDPFEEAIEESLRWWNIIPGGPYLELSPVGNAPAPLRIELTVSETLTNPSVSDGTHALIFEGLVESGSILLFDGMTGRVLVDGEDQTPYTSGLFPLLAPEGTTLSCTTMTGTGGQALARVSYRARWW